MSDQNGDLDDLRDRGRMNFPMRFKFPSLYSTSFPAYIVQIDDIQGDGMNYLGNRCLRNPFPFT